MFFSLPCELVLFVASILTGAVIFSVDSTSRNSDAVVLLTEKMISVVFSTYGDSDRFGRTLAPNERSGTDSNFDLAQGLWQYWKVDET